MSELIDHLQAAGFSALACQFAQFIQRIDDSADPLIAVTAALLSDANSAGHACLNLGQTLANNDQSSLALPATVAEWTTRLTRSNTVGAEDQFTPLILTAHNQLYLYRCYLAERNIAQAIRQRCVPLPLMEQANISQQFAAWNSEIVGIDWQKVAVFTALRQQFSVISGGPGTGKTTVVLRLLAMLQAENNTLNIALTAPTGKAVARLQQVINQGDLAMLTFKTLHRLLGISDVHPLGRYHARNPLSLDMVIVDEASMMDSELFALLLAALPKQARLVLLGDKQQLASVGSGAVLANLAHSANQFSGAFCEHLTKITGIELAATRTDSLLTDHSVALQHNYRFQQHSEIGQLAAALQAADVSALLNILKQAQPAIWQQQCDIASISSAALLLYQPFFSAINDHADPVTCLQLFEQQRILTALTQGPQSVQAINELIERQLQKQQRRSQTQWYHGKPIMVTKNDYRQQLFNGDTGLILADQSGELKACFLVENNLRWFELARLPAYQTAYAITIHKSQGSEFANVIVLLAEQDNPLLTRELLYTAISRASKQILLLASQEILAKTATRQQQRETGLATLLAHNS